jgi:NADH dehydrogenase/NADH:ubiquinone oxidoreductase subunit G
MKTCPPLAIAESAWWKSTAGPARLLHSLRRRNADKDHRQKTARTAPRSLEIILSNHPNNCPECIKNGRCELQAWPRNSPSATCTSRNSTRNIKGRDESSPSITLDPSYCIQCGRCVYVCNEIQDVHALENSDRGFNTFVGPTFNRPLETANASNAVNAALIAPWQPSMK